MQVKFNLFQQYIVHDIFSLHWNQKHTSIGVAEVWAHISSLGYQDILSLNRQTILTTITDRSHMMAPTVKVSVEIQDG